MSSVVGGVGGAILGAGIIGGGAAIAGSLISSNAAGGAAQTQADASKYAADIQDQQFQQQQQNIKPWIDAGKGALPELQSMANKPVNFTSQDFANNMDPAYQFDLQQGQQALERSAAARGSLMSGGTLKDLTSYAQGTASNEYQNAYNRFMNSQNTSFNRLASVAGLGQTGTGMLASAGMNAANNIGNIATGAANASAANSIAQGNIWGGTLSGLGSNIGNSMMGYQNMSMMNNWMNRMYPSTPGVAPAMPSAASGGGGMALGDYPSSNITASLFG